jgi:integrase
VNKARTLDKTPSKPRGKRYFRELTDIELRMALDLHYRGTLYDAKVKGLRVRFGVHRTSFVYEEERWRHNRRLSNTYKTLGYFPDMGMREARDEAKKIAGRNAAGRISPGRRKAKKVGEAMAEYIAYLKSKAEEKGKPAAWARSVESIARHHILPAFEKDTLAQLSASPDVVMEWHKKISEAGNRKVIANQAAKILRAMYRRAARLDRTLPSDLPTSAVELNPESRSQRALQFGDFPQWFAAWSKIKSPIRRAFHCVNLLTGARPGELARLTWSDIDGRSFTIRGAKAQNDIVVPMSAAIAWAFKLARAHRVDGNPYVFPARSGHIMKFDLDGLPVWGMSLRRTWRTVAADAGVDELLAHFLLGHIPTGISRGYVAKLALASGQGMRNAQRKVSLRILRLLRGKP